MAGNIFIATQTGVTDIDGTRYTFEAGVTRVRAGHALLKACPNCFKPAGENVTYDVVEAATANPGQLRGAPPTPAPATPGPVTFPTTPASS